MNDNFMNQNNRVIRLHCRDNVAVALENLSEGTTIRIGDLSLPLVESVSIKHKFTLAEIKSGEAIFLYGVKVGEAVKNIPKGAAVTTENTVNATSEVKRNTPGKYKWETPLTAAFKNRSFMGFHRPDGQVGTANHWLVIPMVFCENKNIEVIKEAVLSELGYQQDSRYRQFTRELISLYKEGSKIEVLLNKQVKQQTSFKAKLFKNVTGIQFLLHSSGCGGTRQDAQDLCGLLAGYITHPNVAGATILSLGCQNAQLSVLKEEIKKRDPNFSKPFFELEHQKIGTQEDMIRQAIQSIFKGLMHADQIERRPAPLSKLCIALQCGGSDGFSGISANPAIGYASDLIVALGGSSILAEFPELSGIERNLYERCTEQADGDRFLDLMLSYNKKAESVGSGFFMNPSPGNIRDGLITDAMKSAGAAKKGGTAPVSGVLDYPEKLKNAGLNLLCTPGNDVESVTAEVASGANLTLFTTGMGTPTGNVIVPVIKISTNTATFSKMPDIIDINTGTIIDGTESIEKAGERILDYVIDVASGITEPAAVRNRQNDFIPWKRGVSL